MLFPLRLCVSARKIVFFLLTTFPLLASSTLSEQEISEIEHQIELRQTRLQSLQMDFIQNVTPPDEEKPIQSHGSVFYQKPQKMRISYKNPEGEGLLLTSTETLQWKKGLLPKAEPVSPEKRSFRRIMLDVLEQKPSSWDLDFKKTMRRENKSIFVQLTPRDANSKLPEKINISLRTSDWLIAQIEVHSHGLEWNLSLSHFKINPSFKPDLFVWKKTMTSPGFTPHGPGFRFIDRMEILEPGKKVRAHKWLDPQLDFFKDHFPGEPLMPGVLLIEAAAQTAGVVWGSTSSEPQRLFLAKVLQFAIKRAVLPDQTIEIEAELERDFGQLGQFAVTIRESTDIVAQGSLILSRTLQQT